MIAQRAPNQAMQKQASNLSQNSDDNKMIPKGIIKPIIIINKAIIICNILFLFLCFLASVLKRLITSETSIGIVSIDTMQSINCVIIPMSLFIMFLMSSTIIFLSFKMANLIRNQKI